MHFIGVSKKLIVSLSTVLMVGALAACSGSSDEGNGSGGEGPSSATLRIGYPAPPYKFDPATTFGADRLWLKLIYDPLIELDPQTLEPLPSGDRALAESWEFTDPLTLHIKLRDGVTFQDGAPLSAEGVKESIERYQDLSLLQIYRLPTLDEIEVVGDLELDLKLTAPDARLPGRLGNEVGMIVSPKAIEESYEDMSDTPVGTGPYELSDYTPGSKVVLERNDDYWGGTPGYAEMSFTIYSNTVSMVQAFQAGQLDLLPRTPLADQKAMEQSDQYNIEITPTLSDAELAINTKNPDSPFKDVRVRNAIDMALDRDTLAELGTEGYGVPTNQPFPPEYQYYDQDLDATEGRDVEEAKRLISEVYPDGLSLSCPTYVGSFWEPAVPELINEFKEIGIDLKIDVLNLQELNDQYYGNNGAYCAFRALTAQYPVDVALNARLATNSSDGGLTDPDQLVDQGLLDGVRVAEGEEATKEAVSAALAAAEEADLSLPVFTRPESMVMTDAVAGYVPNLGNPDLSTLKPSG